MNHLQIRVTICLALMASTAIVRGQEWTRFRGPNGSGVGESARIPARWSESHYITPCLYQADGPAPELIFTNWDHGITSIDPKTGQKNWELDIFDKGHAETAISSPIVADDLIIATCGWLGVRKEVVAVRPSAEEPGEADAEVYRIVHSAPLCTTPLVKDRLLFLWSDEGIVTCANVATGEIIWRERVGGTFYGSPVSAGGKLYCVSANGDMVVLAASAKYEMLARIPLGEGSHSTPALARGAMFIRTFTQLFSIGGQKSSVPTTERR